MSDSTIPPLAIPDEALSKLGDVELNDAFGRVAHRDLDDPRRTAILAEMRRRTDERIQATGRPW